MSNLPVKMTYAIKSLEEMKEKRIFKQFCLNNGIDPSRLLRIVNREREVTYRIMAELCHIIPPIEWLFTIDEELPYEAKTCERYDCDSSTSKFVFDHKTDYKLLAKDAGIDGQSMYLVFDVGNRNPSPEMIRKLLPFTDPINFFIPAKTIENYNNPERGDIIMYMQKLILVLSDGKHNRKTNYMTGLPLSSVPKESSIKVNRNEKYYSVNELTSYDMEGKVMLFYGRISERETNGILKKVRSFL